MTTARKHQRNSASGDTPPGAAPARRASPAPLSEHDIYLFNEGTHRRLWDKLGAHLATVDGVDGVAFAVWAPNARRVSVVGDFCQWDGRIFPMRRTPSSVRPASASSGGSNVFIVTMPGASADSIWAPALARDRRRAVISTSGSSGMESPRVGCKR